MFTDATSLTTTPTRSPPLLCRSSVSSVVLPEPRKPDSREIGTRGLLAAALDMPRTAHGAGARAARRQNEGILSLAQRGAGPAGGHSRAERRGMSLDIPNSSQALWVDFEKQSWLLLNNAGAFSIGDEQRRS
jgi:hypothetical protein